jgi:hypothetical protein
MNKPCKRTVCLLAAALLLFLFAFPAMADVTAARSLGDGSVDVQWDSQDDAFIYMVPKMSDDFDADLKTYGYVSGELDAKRRRATMYFMAPGQSYWLYTGNQAGELSRPYAYNAPAAATFNEFKNQPKFESIILRQTDMSGKIKGVKFFSAYDIEDDLLYTTYSARIKFTWVWQKEKHSYIGQTVILTPDGEYIVQDAYQQDIPIGNAYVQANISLQDFFSTLLKRRGTIPVGKYIISIYWDGKLACSNMFYVR